MIRPLALCSLLTLCVALTGCGNGSDGTSGSQGVKAPASPAGPPPPPPSGAYRPIDASCSELVAENLQGDYRVQVDPHFSHQRYPRRISLTRRDQRTYQSTQPGFLPGRPGYVLARLETFRGHCAFRWYNPGTRDSEFSLVLGRLGNGTIVLGGDYEEYPILELRPAPAFNPRAPRPSAFSPSSS